MATTRTPTASAAGAAGVPGVLASLRRQVRELGETLWSARPATELMDTITEVETLKATLDSLELDVVHELEATGGVKSSGWASTQDFVTHTTGGHKGTGPATIRLAAAVREPIMAPVGEALADGWLSTAKAHVIARAIDALPGNPDLRVRGVQTLLDEAKRLDATDLKKVARHLVHVVDPDGEDRAEEKALDQLERVAHHRRRLAFSDDGAGGTWITGRCTTEDAALIKSSLLPLAKPQPAAGPTCDPATCTVPGCSHDGRDPRDHGARMLDALVEACRRLQTADLLPDTHGAPPRVTVTMDLDDLRDTAGHATTETGEDLSAATARRMACDADVVPVVLSGASQVLDVGQQMRLASAAIWKALVVHDRHCRFPHCTRPPVMCHAHHVRHWADGGPTSLGNLVLLCGHHHRLVHAGPWQILATSDGGWEFVPPPTAGSPPDEPGRAPPDG